MPAFNVIIQYILYVLYLYTDINIDICLNTYKNIYYAAYVGAIIIYASISRQALLYGISLLCYIVHVITVP